MGILINIKFDENITEDFEERLYKHLLYRNLITIWKSGLNNTVLVETENPLKINNVLNGTDLIAKSKGFTAELMKTNVTGWSPKIKSFLPDTKKKKLLENLRKIQRSK